MAKRMIIMLLVVGTLIAGLAIFKYRQIEAAIANSAYTPPPEAITTAVVHEEDWHLNVTAIGTVAAVHGVTVSADLPGIVEKIHFESGDRVKRGDVLVLLDTKQERAQLAATEARLELARLNLDRIRGLREKGVTSQAENDAAKAEFDQAQASVGEIRAAIDRKTITAPFTGILGIRAVNLGQYLNSGDPVVPLQSLDPAYVNFDVPQQELHLMDDGAEVRVAFDGTSDDYLTGKISAVNSVVDASTRNVQVQATLANPKNLLRPGMFVRVEVVLDETSRVIPIPTSAINYAPYGDSVFVVEEMAGPDGNKYQGVRQQFVKLGASRGDQTGVIGGIEPGVEIATSGAFKLRTGAAVQVNNDVVPGNDPAPTPEED